VTTPGEPVAEFEARVCTTDAFFLGEGCRWDEARSELYWVSIHDGAFLRARVNGPEVTVVRRYNLGGFVTAVAPMQDRRDGWIVAKDQGVYHLAESGALTRLAEPEAARAREVRFNDGAADPWGRFWIGSMAFDTAPGRGTLFRFHELTGAEVVVEGATISNGLGWSPDRRSLYYVDSGPATIDRFDVDERGEVANRRTLVAFDAQREGTPDGLCVDAEGALWVALWGGYEVRRYTPSGDLVARVRLATAEPSSCALGGASGTTLYITTAREDLSEATLAAEADAGRLFCAEVGVPGQPLDAYRPMRR
jgi:sugar lactone lactonase YvrE